MKKIIKVLAIILVLTLFSAIALGSGSDDDSKKEIDGAEGNTPAQEEKVDVTIEEQVVFDAKDVKITVTEYVKDSFWGDGMKLYIENNSKSDVGIGCEALIVNDYMISDLFSETVAAGKKSNEILYFSSSELEAAGIVNIGQIEVYFYLYDASSYETTYKADPVTIKTSAFDSMDITPNDMGKELYNKGGIRIVGKYVDEDSFWGASVLLFIENKSGKNICVSCEDMSINGYMVEAFMSSTVYDGKMAVDSIEVFESDLEENEIESVDDVELKFHIYNADSYKTIDDTGVISFSTK